MWTNCNRRKGTTSTAAVTVTILLLQIIILSVVDVTPTSAAAACSSCLVSSAIGAAAGTHHQHHRHGSSHPSTSSAMKKGPSSSSFSSTFLFMATRRMVQRFGPNAPTTIFRNTANEDYENELERILQENMDDTKNDRSDSNDDPTTVDSKSSSSSSPPVSAAMVGAIGVYKNYISPLLPPACRFVPTCSQYGVQAIREFGPAKGTVLTAWRLMRCSPFGGRGYDPPVWPPVFYTHGSY